MKTLLVGNPNVGKSTLFNTITKSNSHTGNWHGVTVEENEKEFKVNDKKFTLVDLPGIYSLSPNSYEEEVCINYILNNPESPIICLCNSSNLKHNLLLLTELIELGRSVVLVINQINNNSYINIKKLEEKLKVKVVLCNAKSKKDVSVLLKIIYKNNFKKNNFNFKKNNEFIILKNKLNKIKIPEKQLELFCHKALSKDEYYINLLKKYKNNIILKTNNDDYLENRIQEKYNFIDELLIYCKYKSTRVVGKSKIDKLILNKYLCIPIFIAIVGIVFYITFFSVGQYLSEFLRYVLQDVIGKNVCLFLNNHISVKWIIDLVEVAIFGGVATVVSFLPQVVLLFLFLDILEESGYISRLAFMLDDTLHKLGLSGKSVYTLLMGFGCSTTACLTARNMTDKNAKIKTAMLAPFMSCSAKLPVYAVIGGAFFGQNNILIIILLYLLGIILALLLSLFFEKSYLQSNNQSFIMEFPDYQTIKLKKLAKTTFSSAKIFIYRIGSVLIALSVIIWVLENFSFTFTYVQGTTQKSMFQHIGEFLSPIFKPLGFSSWGLSCALLAGLVAKEIIISSIAIFNNINPTSDNFMQNVSNSLTLSTSVVFLTPASALSFMVFCLLYCPCLATISVLKKEIGPRWTTICVLMQLLLAYTTAMIVYFMSRLIEIYGFFTVLIITLLIFILGTYTVKLFTKKQKKCCKNCSSCYKNCK